MTHLSGTIGPWEAEEAEDRHAVMIPHCWERQASPNTRLASAGVPGVLVAAREAARLLPPPGPDDVLLAVLAAKPPEILIDAVLEAADRGTRVYLLAESDFGESGVGREFGKKSKARVLVRRLSGLCCSAVLADRGRTGGLFIGPGPSEEAPWFFPLSGAQGEAMFRLALRLFWHEASDEAWTSTDGLQFAEPRDRPFDVPLLAPGAPVHFGSGGRTDDKVSVWHSPAGVLPAEPPPSTVVVPPTGVSQDALAAAVRGGSTVAWSAIGLPTLSTGSMAGTLELASERFPVHVQLEAKQAAAVESIVSSAVESAAWRFAVDAALGDLDGEVWLPGSPSPQSPIARHDHHCGRTEAESLDGFTTTNSPDRPTPPVLAKSVRWRWTVLPPRVPPAAKADPLIASWQRLDDEVSKRLDIVRERLGGVAEHEGAIGKAFAALAGALKGFGRTRSALGKKVDELAASKPSSLVPEEATQLLTALSELEDAAGALGVEVVKAESKAQDDRERERQQSDFDGKREQAEKDLTALRVEREERQKEFDQAQVELGEFATNDGAQMSRNERRALQKKLKAKAEQTKKRLSAVEHRVSTTQAILAEEFEFRPSRKPPKSALGRAKGARFVPTAKQKKTTSSPAEGLPRVGALYAHKGQRYLAITTWEQLEDGEAESQRLDAHLVAPAEK